MLPGGHWGCQRASRYRQRPYSSDAEGSEVEAEVGTVQGEQAGVNINFEMSACSNVSLPIALVLHHLPADLVVNLEVTLGVHVGRLAIKQKVSALSSRVEFPDLNVSFHGREG